MTDERSARELSFTFGVETPRDPQAPVSADNDADDAVGIVAGSESAEL
jgi:hypothetical protein